MASREKKTENEDRLWAIGQRFKEAQKEVAEISISIHTQQQQLEEYKQKYLDAQQHVEEQRKEIDKLQQKNDCICEQIDSEVQKVKSRYHEKLRKTITPLYDVLVATVQKLQEYQQMQLLAERNNAALECELQTYKEKVAEMESQIEKMQQFGEGEKTIKVQCVKKLERKCRDTVEENNRLKVNNCGMEDLTEQNKKKVEMKLHEIAQQVMKLETLKDESAKLFALTKDQYSTVCNCKNKSDQTADLATAKSAHGENSELKQKLQSHITDLTKNFEALHVHIAHLQRGSGISLSQECCLKTSELLKKM